MVEERPDVQRVSYVLNGELLPQYAIQALQRLSPAESYDRAYRLKRASQASVQHKPLPVDQWTTPEEVPK